VVRRNQTQKQQRSDQQRSDWYSVSVDSLKALTTFVVLVVVGIGGFFGFRSFEREWARREAGATIEAAQVLIQDLLRREDANPFRHEISSAQTATREARRLLDTGEVRQAQVSAASAKSLLDWITDALAKGDVVGEAQFISVAGDVAYRRGDAGNWEPARGRVVLGEGDYVRAGPGGSAEIMAASGTLYTLRPNTLFRIAQTRSRSGTQEQGIRMEYGWLNLNTGKRESTVETPEAAASLERDSYASVTYDKSSGRARFVAFEGSMKVATNAGTERQLGALEQVVATRDQLSATTTVPAQPEASEPGDNLQLNLAQVDQLALGWRPVPGAARYALQVSRSQLFVDNVIDRSDRQRTGATLGLKGEGTFFWRVAAVNAGGVTGPWSEPRKFRIASLRGTGVGSDKTPPPLQLQNSESYGSIFIVGGTTEPGAEVEVNGEPVAVTSEGSFRKTIQFTQEGWNLVTVRARDAWGNQVERRQRVFVELL
jgi:hypothetical protein